MEQLNDYNKTTTTTKTPLIYYSYFKKEKDHIKPTPGFLKLSSLPLKS